MPRSFLEFAVAATSEGFSPGTVRKALHLGGEFLAGCCDAVAICGKASDASSACWGWGRHGSFQACLPDFSSAKLLFYLFFAIFCREIL